MFKITLLDISIGNIANLIIGITFGFFVMIILSCAIISKKMKKHNENDNIRNISISAYEDFYLKKYSMKDKIISSIIYEVQSVSKEIHPDKKHPLYELSINDVIDALKLIQRKLKKFTTHPLLQYVKNIHISTLLSLEDITRPFMILYKKKSTKILMMCYKVVHTLINLINPIFYIKKILTFFMSKRGKKDAILIMLDYIGNTTHQIYSSSKTKTP